MKKTKYQIDGIETINFIKSNFGYSNFGYSQIQDFFNNKKITSIMLYNLRVTGILKQEHRGVYCLDSSVKYMTEESICAQLKESLVTINLEKKNNRIAKKGYNLKPNSIVKYTPRHDTMVKMLKFLLDVKQRCDNGLYFSMQELCLSHRIGKQTPTVMKLNNIISNENGLWKFNYDGVLDFNFVNKIQVLSAKYSHGKKSERKINAPFPQIKIDSPKESAELFLIKEINEKLNKIMLSFNIN